jgi:hypothetical protein
VQAVDDDRHQTGGGSQALARNHIPAPVVSNAIMYFIELEVNHPLRLNSNITDATAMQVYRAVVSPGLVFANWK